MDNSLLKIVVLLIVGFFGISLLFAVVTFLSLPIMALIDGIKDKKKKKALESSELIKGIRELNSSFSYEAIQPEYCFTKVCNSKAEYDRTQPRQFLHTVLNQERDLIRELENAVEYNITIIDNYEAQCEDILMKCYSDPSNKVKNKKLEIELFEKEKLYIGTTYSFKIAVSFVTPQRRNRYYNSKSFPREELLEEVRKVNRERIDRNRRLAEMEYERSRMTAKLRYEVLKRDNYRCRICGASASDGVTQLHVDHIVPVARGGKTELNNLQTLCQRCNLGKGISD